MSIISHYLRWPGHDAGESLPPEDVLVGVLADGVWPLPPNWAPLEPGETLVYVPPQWIGDWETGHCLAAGYQHVWRVPRASLCPLYLLCPALSRPRFGPYRPGALPSSASGPTARTARPNRPRWSRSRSDSRSETALLSDENDSRLYRQRTAEDKY